MSTSDGIGEAGKLPSAGIWMSWIDDGPVLRRRAMRLTRGNREEAEDLLSSTLIKAVSHVERHATDVREPRAFLLFAMRNEYISGLRRRTSEGQVRDFQADVYQDHTAGLADIRPDQENLLRHQDALRQVVHVVNGLSPEFRQVFKLRFCEDCSYREIAGKLDISEPLARKRVQHLRAHLRGVLTDFGGELQGEKHARKPLSQVAG